MNYSTDTNKPGARYNGKKLVDLQNFIVRKAPLFGLEVLSRVYPRPVNRLNIDSIYQQLKSIIAARLKMRMPGQLSNFVKFANQVNVALDIDYIFAGPAIVISSIANTTATATWDPVVIPGYNVVYDIQVIRVSNSAVALTEDDLTAVTKSITGLTSGIEYQVKVRAKWADGTFFTGWSSIKFTTT